MMDISSDIKCCRATNTCFKTWKKVRRRCIQEQVEDRELVKVLYSAYRSRTATSRLVPECMPHRLLPITDLLSLMWDDRFHSATVASLAAALLGLRMQ